MNGKLFAQAITKAISGLLLVGFLLFLPAGSFLYWNGWLLIAVLFVPMIVAGFVMMKKNPELLRKRLNVKEEQSEQKTVIVLSGVMFIAAFIVAGLNFRFCWIVLQNWIVYAATAVFLLGYILYAEVLRENAYLSRTVEVQENQKVIDTVISFVIMLVYIPIIAKRISNEERVLEEGLAGYSDYKKQVKYKIIPYVW